MHPMDPKNSAGPNQSGVPDDLTVDETSPTYVETAAPSLTGGPVSIPGFSDLVALHQGGQGTVYRALQDSTKRIVAVKILGGGSYAADTAKRRFQREVEIVAQLRHPNIVSIFDSGQTPDGLPYFVMEYIEGLLFDDHVREKKLPLDEALRLFVSVLDAVEYAHQAGVIHRDLKPSNILVDTEGNPKVVDFGLARPIFGGGDSVASATGQMLGTFAYMSPEQVRGKPDEIDARTDVYSLGMILYGMCTGKSPYPVDSQIVEVLRHITETPPTFPIKAWNSATGITVESLTQRDGTPMCPIDTDLETILLRTITKDRQRRYPSVAALAKDLQSYVGGQPITAKRDNSVYVLRKKVHRHRSVVIPIASAVLVAVAAVFLIPRSPEAPPIDNESRLEFLAGETEYAEIRQELLETLERQSTSGHGAENPIAASSLQLVQDAVLELKTALQKDPGNQALQELLLKNYHREIRLMRKMCELPI